MSNGGTAASRRGRKTGAVGPGVLLLLAALPAVLLPASPAHARASITALPAGNRVMLGETVEVTVSIESNEQGSPQLIPPSSPDFRFEGQPMQSSRFELINGRARRSLEYTFVLRPGRAGEIQVGSFVYQNPYGSTVRSEPFTLQVLQPPPPPRAVEEISGDEPLTVLQEATPSRIYMGQQVTVSVTRYARVNMDECRAAPTTVPKAWIDELLDAPPRPRIVKLRGTAYEVGELRRVALFPLESGALEVPAVEVQCRTVGRGFFGGGDVLTRRSAALTLDVLPLPEEGRPPGFAGAVGTFRFTSKLERNRTRVGEPVTLALTVSGQGNFRGFALAAPTLPQGLTVYPPTSSDRTSYDGQGRLQGTKTMEVIVAPTRAGRFEIPPLSFAYFDPGAEVYREARTRPLTLEVEPPDPAKAGGGHASPGWGGAGGGLDQPELPDLRPLRPGGHALLPGSRTPRPLPEHPLLWLGLAVPPLALVLAELRERLLRSRRKSEGLLRYRRARRIARQRLEQAGARAAGSGSAAWGEAAATLHGYLRDRLGEPTLGLTREALSAVLKEQGFAPATVAGVVTFLDEADLARFAGGLPGGEPLQAAQRVLGLIDELDRHQPPGGLRAAREQLR